MPKASLPILLGENGLELLRAPFDGLGHGLYLVYIPKGHNTLKPRFLTLIGTYFAGR